MPGDEQLAVVHHLGGGGGGLNIPPPPIPQKMLQYFPPLTCRYFSPFSPLFQSSLLKQIYFNFLLSIFSSAALFSHFLSYLSSLFCSSRSDCLIISSLTSSLLLFSNIYKCMYIRGRVKNNKIGKYINVRIDSYVRHLEGQRIYGNEKYFTW